MSEKVSAARAPADMGLAAPAPAIADRLSRKSDAPPARPPKLPSYDETTGEETLTFVVPASADQVFTALLDVQAFIKAEQPSCTVARTSGPSKGVGANYEQILSNCKLRIEIRKAVEGRHIVQTVDITEHGNVRHALQRWDLAPYHGDENMCQVTRISSARTLESMKKFYKSKAGPCGIFMGSKIQKMAQEQYLGEVDRVKFFLEHYSTGGVDQSTL